MTLLSLRQAGSRTGRFWTYIADEHPYSVDDFTESRARDGPANFLRGFDRAGSLLPVIVPPHLPLFSSDSFRELSEV